MVVDLSILASGNKVSFNLICVLKKICFVLEKVDSLRRFTGIMLTPKLTYRKSTRKSINGAMWLVLLQMIIKLKSPKGKWMFYAGQMELSELIFLQTIGNILPTCDLLLSDNYQDSGGEGGGAYI